MFLTLSLITSLVYMIGQRDSEGIISFLQIAEDSQFPIQNIPFGVFSVINGVDVSRPGTRIGDWVVDLRQMQGWGMFDGQLFQGLGGRVFQEHDLGSFMRLTRQYWVEARMTIQNTFGQGSALQFNQEMKSCLLYRIQDVRLHMPVEIGGYTDFYSSKAHAFNIGSIIRGPENALNENWFQIPIGYHGRSSSIVVSRTDFRRPRSQTKANDTTQPTFSECKMLDYQIQIGTFLVGNPNELGKPIKVNQAWNHVFGFVLLNDWSFRDFQRWQHIPLGPFTAKNGITTISPWIVTLQALQGCQVTLQKQQPTPLKYIQQQNHISYDINLNVAIQTQRSQKSQILCTTNFKYVYWSVAQQLVHHAVTGCNMGPGDILGSGVISGDKKEEFGSLLELTWGGRDEVVLENGQTRKFIQNGDSITMTGWAIINGKKIGFGECKGTILPPFTIV